MQCSLDRLGIGTTGTPWRKSQVLNHGVKPRHQCWGLESSPREGLWEHGEQQAPCEPVVHPYSKSSQELCGLHQEQYGQQSKRWGSLSLQHWWDHSWSSVSSSRLLNARHTQTCRNNSSTAPQRWVRDWRVLHKRKGWHSWDCSVCRRVWSEGFYQCVQALWWEGRKREPGILSSVHWQEAVNAG